MLDRLPEELVVRIGQSLSQSDKVALTYVSKKVYDAVLPILYANLYLNEKHYCLSDLDETLGTTEWSVLWYPYIEGKEVRNQFSTQKMESLIKTLESDPARFGPLIQNVHCTWHLDDKVLERFLIILQNYGTNLLSVDNFLKEFIFKSLLPMASQLNTLSVIPPDILPNLAAANEEYYTRMYQLCDRYDWQNLQTLTLHVNACTFFDSYSDTPLKIESLTLNLRPDTFNSQQVRSLNNLHYYDIFDKTTLQQLEILSWYDEVDSDLKIYELWQLNDFWHFTNIKEMHLLSLVADVPFLSNCIKNFQQLRRLKLDYLFDVTVPKEIVELISRSKCASTLKYMDLKFDTLEPPIVNIEQDEISLFEITMTCKCQDCQDTFSSVIMRKYFPTQESLIIRDFENIAKRNFVMQMFKLYPIIPYCHAVDKSPSIGFYSAPLSYHAEKISSLLELKDRLTTTEIIKVYHAYIHSLKKTFDYFIQRIPNLQYLVLNELPTKVIQVDQHQRCNVPIFHNYNYKSNQVYELVNDESLFD